MISPSVRSLLEECKDDLKTWNRHELSGVTKSLISRIDAALAEKVEELIRPICIECSTKPIYTHETLSGPCKKCGRKCLTDRAEAPEPQRSRDEEDREAAFKKYPPHFREAHLDDVHPLDINSEGREGFLAGIAYARTQAAQIQELKAEIESLDVALKGEIESNKTLVTALEWYRNSAGGKIAHEALAKSEEK